MTAARCGRRAGRMPAVVMLAAGILWSLVPGRPAHAVTVDGTLITNVASATYKTTGGVPVEFDFNVTAFVLVGTPQMMIQKTGTPTMQAPGGLVTFCLTFSNQSAYGGALNFVLTDAIPDNMRFYQELFTNAPAGGTIVPSWSDDGGATWEDTAGVPPNGGGPGRYPNAGWPFDVILRWTVDLVDTQQSGYVCYTASIL